MIVRYQSYGIQVSEFLCNLQGQWFYPTLEVKYLKQDARLQVKKHPVHERFNFGR